MSERDLAEALERLRKVREPKRRMIIKAVVNYIHSMAGEVDERGT